MSSINVELKLGSASKSVSHAMKSGNAYVVYVSESFDVNNGHDLQDLVRSLNSELRKDGIEEVEMRKVDRELKRLSIGKKVEVRIS
jgi:ribosomal protein S12 methylthiotransferase accessory factor YcaO